MKGGLVGMGIGLVRGGGRRVAPVPPVVAEGGGYRVETRRPLSPTTNQATYRKFERIPPKHPILFVTKP